MKTVLFIPVGLGLAHAGRLIMIARRLKKERMNIIFGAGTDAIDLMRREHFKYEVIPEFPKEIYEKNLKNNNPFVYTQKIIEEFVRAELNLYRKVKPDLIVYDARFTARISAEIAGIKTISICNANMTPYYDFSKIKFPINTLLSKFISKKMLSILNRKYGQEFMKKVGPKIVQAVLIVEMIRMSPALLKLGYRLKRGAYQLLLGDVTLLTDIPEYRPVVGLPKNVKMIGPIFWDGGKILPKWSEILRNKKNIIYVTAGGTGDRRVFIKILEYLRESNYTVVATTGNTLAQNSVNVKYPDLYLTDYLHGDFILPKSKLIIFPGGNATCYQALSFGVPQILTPLHIDQEDNANQLERLGTGIMINPYTELTSRKLLKTITEVMSDNSYKRNSIAIQNILKKYNGPERAVNEIKKLIS